MTKHANKTGKLARRLAILQGQRDALLSAAKTIVAYHTPELSGTTGFAELIAAIAKSEDTP